MGLIDCKCANCGATVKIDDESKEAICQYCGSKFIVERAIQTYNNVNVTDNNINVQTVNIYVTESDKDKSETITDEETKSGVEERKSKRFFSLRKPKRIPVKTICYCAVLMALGVVANVFTVYFNFSGSNALAFTYTVGFLAGALMGPFAGFIVGAGGDLLGWIINPAGAFNPLITLTSGLLGLLPGLTFFVAKKLVKDKKKFEKLIPVWTAIAFVLVWLFCTNINTVIYFYFFIFGKSKKYATFWLYYAYRIPFQTLFWAINSVISLALIYPLKKLLKL